jgi:glutamate-5-semialdehyde dehydrogenase
LEGIADAVEAVTRLPEVLGEELELRVMPSGIDVRRVRVPLGVVGCIYEARPNVTVDVATLCLRTGNAVVLKGGREAARTNAALASLMRAVVQAHGLPEAAVTLIAPTHEAAEVLMTAEAYVDALIPRGSARLIRAVREKARVPVIETGAGVCHIYVHADADVQQAAQIIANAKTRRVSVCNALDCLLVHRALADQVEALLAPCVAQGVGVHTEPEQWGTEWLSMNLSLRIVDSFTEAVDHIAAYGSGHSEAILTQDMALAQQFCQVVDAACVYVNTPTSFTDGGEFGLGAEVGISTQKLHARGPMGLAALTTSKWLITSNGALRGR